MCLCVSAPSPAHHLTETVASFAPHMPAALGTPAGLERHPFGGIDPNVDVFGEPVDAPKALRE
jgi:hypothetical protein